MNRRNFLSLLAASLTLDPERLLWTPGKKLISIPNPVVVEPLFDEISVATLASIQREVISDNFFIDIPFKEYIRRYQPSPIRGMWIAAPMIVK